MKVTNLEKFDNDYADIRGLVKPVMLQVYKKCKKYD